MNCTTCRYSQIDHDPGEGFDDGPLLRCHRYPPTVVALGDEPVQTWPNVGANDWCGEHRGAPEDLIDLSCPPGT